MSKLSEWLKSLFIKPLAPPATSNVVTPPAQVHAVQQKQWEKAKQESREWLLQYLLNNEALTFTMECGGDEALLYFDEPMEWNIEEPIYTIVVEGLDIPDAGEFSLTGGGALWLEGKVVKGKYNGLMRESVDYNEETEEEIFGREFTYGKEAVLFHI